MPMFVASLPIGLCNSLTNLPQLTVAEYIRKSLIAAYLGNIIGALFVAVPAIYFYLSDSSADNLRRIEEGEVFNEKVEIENGRPSEATCTE